MSSPEQTEKSKKYDRQIRLWGEHGQSLLEGATVCLVNATAVGCEALKALVLPSVGGFTIADGSVVSEHDLGVNFFLDATQIGQSKAKACMQLLQELNSDVTGDYVDESIDYLLANRPTFFDTFDVVVASNLSEQTLLQLARCLWEANIPLIYCRSLGFFGSIRLQLREHCVIETHPDNPPFDLRLEHPFTSLKKHFESTPVTNKVPWLLVLYKCLQQWRTAHDDRVPQTFKEKSQLREMIRDGMPAPDEENYEEAIKAVNTAFGGGLVPHNLRAILDDDACTCLDKSSSAFWVMVRALSDFVQSDNDGLLPLAGVLPDMTSNTAAYIDLQKIYRQQALQDADSVYRKCQAHLKELGLPADQIGEKTVRLFCREAGGLAVVRGSRIADEYERSSGILAFVNDLEEQQGTLTEQYLALRAYERFLSECGNTPGECYVETDTSRLKTIASKMLADWGAPHASISDDMIHEICRYGGAEIHSISAFIGGCVAQEVIKIITKQYKPIDNTLLYNAITTETSTMKL